MGRKAFGEPEFLTHILEVAKDKDRINLPLTVLKNKTGLTKQTVRLYISRLEAKGIVRLEGYGECQELVILKKDFVFPELKAAPKAPKKKKPPKPTVSEPTPKTVSLVPASKRDFVVALVDYDNAFLRARDERFLLSFSKLKELLQEYGEILFADVFISPVNTNPEAIAKLWSAGFQVIACPMRYKDKDGVDTKMIEQAWKYIERTSMTKLIIVSCDRDFDGLHHMATDKGKEVVFIDVAVERDKLEGEDLVQELMSSPLLENYIKAIDFLVNRRTDLLPEERHKVNVIKAIIRAIHTDISKNGCKSFRSLAEVVFQKLRKQKLEGDFRGQTIRTAMDALVKRKVLLKMGSANIREATCTLSAKHQAVQRALRGN